MIEIESKSILITSAIFDCIILTAIIISNRFLLSLSKIQVATRERESEKESERARERESERETDRERESTAEGFAASGTRKLANWQVEELHDALYLVGIRQHTSCRTARCALLTMAHIHSSMRTHLVV
jgi:hypothetical protein